MQAPICEVCLKSDILCAGCADKLQRGQLSQTEIEISRFINSLSDKIKSLNTARLVKVIDTDIILLVAGRGDGPKLVGKGGAIVKALAKKYNKSIRVLEENDFKPFMQELLHPLKVTGFNILYTPDSEVYRIRVPASQKPHISERAVTEIALKLFGKKAELVFED